MEASGCLSQCRLTVVNLIGCHSVKRLMGTLGVVEQAPLRKPPAQFQSRIKRSQIEILVLEGPPQPLDENIVLYPASAVHADGDVVGFQDSGESLAGELSSLVCVEDPGGAVARNSLLQGSHAKLGIQGVG